MEKEVLPNYIFRESSGNMNLLEDYYSKSFKSCESQFYYMWEYQSFRESILLNNRLLYKEFSNFKNKTSKKKRKLLQTLQSYFVRFCSRPSTYFTFGYVGVGSFSDTSTILTESLYENKLKGLEKVVDVSSEWVSNFLKTLLKNHQFLPELTVFSNSNLVNIGPKVLNQTTHFKESEISKIFLTDCDEILTEILELSRYPVKIQNLIQTLLGKNFELDIIQNYIVKLIDSEILLLECFDIINKDNKIILLESFIKEISVTDQIKRDVTKIREMVELYSAYQLGDGLYILKDLYAIMDKFCKVKTPLNLLYLTRGEDYINIESKDTIEDFLNILLKLDVQYQINPTIEQYSQKFYDLYGSNTLVPLRELLSLKRLGPPSNYCNPLLSTFEGESVFENQSIRNFQKVLVNAVLNATVDTELNLESFLDEKTIIKDTFPTFELVFSIVQSGGKLQLKWNGNQYSDNFFMISGKYISHFQYFLDLQEMLGIENSYYNNQTVVGIDGFHNKLILNDIKRENKIDNLILDFPFLNNVDISKIFVYLDNSNRFKLYSKDLDTELIPMKRNRLSFDLLNNQERFLCSIYRDKLSYYDFYKALSLDYLEYQNRIVYKNIVVYPQTWRIFQKTSLKEFRKRYNLPTFVNLIEGDMELLINLDKELDVEILEQRVSRSNVTILQEYLGGRIDSKELIVFCKNKNNTQYTIPSPYNFKELNPVSNEWISFNLYCKEELVSLCFEKILSKVINLLSETQQSYSFNFIQYYFNDFHLRVRIKKSNHIKATEILVHLMCIFSESVNEGILTYYEMVPYRADFSDLGDVGNTSKIEDMLTFDSIYVINNYKSLRSLPLYAYIPILDCFFSAFGFSNLDLINYFQSIEIPKDYSIYRKIKNKTKDKMDLACFPSQELLLKKFDNLLHLVNDMDQNDTLNKLDIAETYVHLFLNKIFFNKLYEKRIYQLYYLYLLENEYKRRN